MLNRREPLKLGSSAALLARCGNAIVDVDASDPAATGGRPLMQRNPALLPTDEAFPLGVMAGDATATSCVLWTRFDGSKKVSLRVWEDTGQSLVEMIYDQRVIFTNGFALVDVTDLAPNRAYRYCFVVDDTSRSSVGNFRTAYDPDDTSALTFAGSCCTHPRRWPFPVLARAALRNDIRFYINNGDHVYCDGAETLDEYRALYTDTYSQSGMQALHQAFTFYGTWDDHEVDENWDPEEIETAQLEAALRTYYEHTPIRGNRMWRSFRWGRTAEVFMLDCRGERRPSTRKNPNAEYLSRAQMDWLKQGLVTSPAQFKLIVNSVPIGSFGGLWSFGDGDRWEGYAAQREELLSFMLGENVRGAYFLSGDFHCGFAGRVDAEGPYSAFREIVWGPGGQRPNPLYVTLSQPQWDFVTPQANFAVLRADPAADTLSVDLINEDGTSVGSQTYRNDE